MWQFFAVIRKKQYTNDENNGKIGITNTKEVIAVKRFLSAVLAVALLLCTLPAAFAASDIEKHWAKPYLLELNELGVINPSSEGEYTPDQAIRRWEFMRYINRAFGFTEKASINFSDVAAATRLYYESRAGRGEVRLHQRRRQRARWIPEGTLTREQAATILGRLHKYTPSADLSVLNSFYGQEHKLSDYSKSYVAEAVATGLYQRLYRRLPSSRRATSPAAKSPRSCIISSALR